MRQRWMHNMAVVAAVMAVCGTVWAGTYSGGFGTAEQPYRLASSADLLEMAATPDDWGGHFILTKSIDLAGQEFARAVIASDTDPGDDGFTGPAFTGTFDGGGYEIRNLVIGRSNPTPDNDNNFLALFGKLAAGAIVRDLHLRALEVAGDRWLGGIAGQAQDASIVRCSAGGIIHGTESTQHAALIAGETLRTEVAACIAEGSALTGDNSGHVGLLCGRTELGAITDCLAAGTIEAGAGSHKIGGLVGYSLSSQLLRCAGDTTIRTRDESMTIGGLAGMLMGMEGTARQCCSRGRIEAGANARYIGGLIGVGSSIQDCYSLTAVHAAESSSWIGGLMGFNGGLSYCFAAGPVSGGEPVGGLCGEGVNSFRSFWDVDTSGQQTSPGATGLATPTMQEANTYLQAGWDFEGEPTNGTADVWRLCQDGASYPRLRWEVQRQGDFVCPAGVGVEDLLLLSENWLLRQTEPTAVTDINLDGVTNAMDFQMLSEYWGS